jgi:hypothetical protein
VPVREERVLSFSCPFLLCLPRRRNAIEPGFVAPGQTERRAVSAFFFSLCAGSIPAASGPLSVAPAKRTRGRPIDQGNAAPVWTGQASRRQYKQAKRVKQTNQGSRRASKKSLGPPHTSYAPVATASCCFLRHPHTHNRLDWKAPAPTRPTGTRPQPPHIPAIPNLSPPPTAARRKGPVLQTFRSQHATQSRRGRL